MRVLMYGWEFPPHISGGLGVACFGLTQALAALGHRITFVVPHKRRDAADHREPGPLTVVDPSEVLLTTEVPLPPEVERSFVDNVVLTRIDSPLRPYLVDEDYRRTIERLEEIHERDGGTESRGFRIAFTGGYGPNLMAEVGRYARVAGAIAAQVPHDVIHAHDWLTMLAGITARSVSGKPLVVHVHATEFDRSGENVNQVVYDVERLGMHEADRVIAVSHYTKDLVVRRYGVPESKVEVVHNAVLPTPPHLALGKSVQEKIVLFLGRITFQKGPDYFVEAAARVLALRQDVRFVMAGSGDMAPRMIERVGELRIGRHFHFTGFLTGVDLERMFQQSDVYVMPSVSEPFGISPLEAMRYDVPVIISRQSGVSEILRHALKVDFWDVEELANKILALLDHGPLREELIAGGRRELEDIKWEKAARRLGEIYGTLEKASPQP